MWRRRRNFDGLCICCHKWTRKKRKNKTIGGGLVNGVASSDACDGE